MLLSSWSGYRRSLSRRKVRVNGESVLHSWTCLLLVMTVVLVEQDVELGQLRQALEQLREGKAKEIG